MLGGKRRNENYVPSEKDQNQTERDNLYGSWEEFCITLTLYNCGLALNSVLFQCEQDIFQHYHLFPESLFRIVLLQEETSTSLFYQNCQKQLRSNVPNFLPVTSDILHQYFNHHIPVLAHSAAQVIQGVT